jgi:hypothetical protein
MFATLELDYIQHLERGYCVNHPDVIAETKQQVVDRAVKQLLTALQTNGFELDGNILKRDNGWLQYDAGLSKWQYSNDAGVTWGDLGGVLDHTLLTNIGVETHGTIDIHLNDYQRHLYSPTFSETIPELVDDMAGFWFDTVNTKMFLVIYHNATPYTIELFPA